MKPFAAVLAILALVFGLAFVFTLGGTPKPTQAALEAALVCTTCHEPLDESSSPLAQQMKKQIRAQIAAGRTTTQIEDVLRRRARARRCSRSRRTSGFDLLAWLLPFAAIVLGAAAVGFGARAWLEEPRRRRRGRAAPRRADARARASSCGSTRSSPPSTAEPMAEKLPVAFLAGLISVITPCVLPLVPGYLSAVSAVEVDQARRARHEPPGRDLRASRSSPASRSCSCCSAPARPRSRARSTRTTQDDDRRLRPRRDRPRVRRAAAVPERALAPGLVHRAAPRRLGGAARRRVRGRARRRASARCSRRSSCSRARAAASRAA